MTAASPAPGDSAATPEPPVDDHDRFCGGCRELAQLQEIDRLRAELARARRIVQAATLTARYVNTSSAAMLFMRRNLPYLGQYLDALAAAVAAQPDYPGAEGGEQ